MHDLAVFAALPEADRPREALRDLISDEGMVQPNYRPGDLDAGPQTEEQT